MTAKVTRPKKPPAKKKAPPKKKAPAKKKPPPKRPAAKKAPVRKKAPVKRKPAAKKAPAKKKAPVKKRRRGAPKGNDYWKARSSHGRKPIFATPDDLWDACYEYFVWVEANPLQEEKLFSYQGDIVRGTMNKMRAMTLDGLYLFIDIAHSTWNDYRHRNDFSAITTRVEAIIRDQKFAGAAADLLNANIIARDLGLVDKKETELGNKDGAPLAVFSIPEDADPKQAARIYAEFLKSA